MRARIRKSITFVIVLLLVFVMFVGVPTNMGAKKRQPKESPGETPEPILNIVETFDPTIETPRALKRDAIDELEAAKTGVLRIDNQIDRVIDHVENSLDDSLWLDDRHLFDDLVQGLEWTDHGHGKNNGKAQSTPKGHLLGEKVFIEERDAVKIMMMSHKVPKTISSIFELIIAKLVIGDELLAGNAIDEAKVYAGTDKKVDFEIAKAEKNIKKAENMLATNQPDSAIAFYQKAWMAAQNALDLVPPEPYMTSPINSAMLYGPQVIIYGDTVEIVATDLRHADDISYTLFEYSLNGKNWIKIGIDRDGSVDYSLSTCGSSPKGWIGGGVWSYNLDTSEFSEGTYYLKVTMKDVFGQNGEFYREVYYDPTPPIPQLDTATGTNIINGQAEFQVTTPDEDVVSWSLEYYSGSGNYFNQDGHGNVEQDQVGPNGKDGKNRYCAPTAAANSIWRLNGNLTNGTDAKGNSWRDYIHKNIKDLINKYKDNATYKKQIEDFYDDDPNTPGFQYDGETYFDGEGNLTDTGLAMVLACKMGTDPNNGTDAKNVDKGIKDFLKEEGVLVDADKGDKKAEGYTFTSHLLTSTTSSGEQWTHYEEEMRKNESVTITIVRYKGNGADGKPGTADDEIVPNDAHDMSGKDGRKHNDTHYVASFRDTLGQDIYIWWWDNMVWYNNSWYLVWAVRAVSVQHSSCWVPVGQNNMPQNIMWNTPDVHDGFYNVRATIVDEDGFLGTDTLIVQVDNNIPSPEIIYPPNDSFINDLVPVAVIDGNGDEDIRLCNFEYSFDGLTWEEIGIDEDETDGWTSDWDTTIVPNGLCLLRVTMVDWADNEASDEIMVFINNF